MDEMIELSLKIGKFIWIPVWVFIGVMAVIGALASFKPGMSYIISAGLVYMFYGRISKLIYTTKEDIYYEQSKKKET